MDLIFTISVFVLTVSIIVTFHELGHFIAARLCGVKVLEFSVGFGKRLFGKKLGKDKTDYKISALPLGGYVRMLDEREGDVSQFEKKRAFNNQSLLKRSFIVFAGPFFNFILAIFFYFLIFSGGYTGFKPEVGAVAKNSSAQDIGFLQGDVISKINSIKVNTWSDVSLQVVKFASAKQDIFFEIFRDGRIISLKKIDFRTINFEEKNILGNIGIFSFTNKTLKIGFIEKDSPADKAGFLIGDKFLSINDKNVVNWHEIVTTIKRSPGENLKIKIQRDNTQKILYVSPEKFVLSKLEIGRLGIGPLVDPQVVNKNKIIVEYGFLESSKLAVLKTYDFTFLTLNFLSKLLVGEASFKNISGPVGIAGYAADSFNNGYTSFLSLLAMLSISIGILNLLPIPMLDGGHLMYYLVEFIIRRPISEAVQLIFQQIGMTFLILLSFFALYNDILRIM
mgnify:CR=1 FL=1